MHPDGAGLQAILAAISARRDGADHGHTRINHDVFITSNVGRKPTDLNHGKLLGTGSARKGLVDHLQFRRAQAKVPGSRVFGGMLRPRCFGNREQRRPPHQKTERDLARSRVVRGSDRL